MTRLTIPTPPEFRFRTTVLSHGWLELPPFRHDEDYRTLTYVQRLQDGAIVKLAITADADEALIVDVGGLSADLTARQREDIGGAVRRCFNLDWDLRAFYEALPPGDRYAWVIQSRAGRLMRAPTVWEDLAKTLLTTNTTWNMTKQMCARLVALGEPYAAGEHAFPAPERIAAMSLADFSEHIRAGYRAPYLHQLASAIAAGGVDVEAWAISDMRGKELYREVTALKGFGPYAAGTVLKLLGRFDELALDTVARRMFNETFRNGDKATDAEIRAHYAPFDEWAGLAIWMDVMRRWFTDD